MNAAAPSGIVTFLFTDIEGSTRRWEADAFVMRMALEGQNQVLREAVTSHDGHVFNHTGDGMCAVFSSPRSAVDAAIAAQLKLELPVRMGIATGEADLRGGEYFGTVLNRTGEPPLVSPTRGRVGLLFRFSRSRRPGVVKVSAW